MNQISNFSFQYEVTYRDGRTQTVDTDVDVGKSAEPKGWGPGDFYTLEEDDGGTLVVEHGDNHRKIYITSGDNGLTAADIAKMEGLSEKQITTDWLEDHAEYGSSADTALSTDIGMSLWYATTDRRGEASSNWLLLERGQEYEGLGRVINRGASGESALHPLYVTAYGEGDDPVVKDGITIFQNKSSHVVIQNLNVSGEVDIMTGENILLDNMTFTTKQVTVKDVDHFTIQNSDILDVAHDEPVNEGSTWYASVNRASGLYMSGVDGGLLRDNTFDHNGWADGYDYDVSASDPMPPSYYSHDLYIQFGASDITLQDNIFMRAASLGAQVRSGGFIEGNMFIDNNVAMNYLSGDNFTLMLDNIVTSAGYRTVSEFQGGLSMGIDNQGKLGSLVGNIITHLADPNNPKEIAEKTINHYELSHETGNYYNDTIVYNWATTPKGLKSNPNSNIDGLDTAVLDQTTIQNFTAQLLGTKTATISDLADLLRDQSHGQLDGQVDADIINTFFREGFGLATDLRADSETLRFIPDDRGDGIRWDNRLNWSTGDLPGTQDGDSVDLGGNHVRVSSQTVAVDDFIFGDGGTLTVTGGRINIDGDLSVTGDKGGLQIGNAGQVWIDGYRDADTLNVDMTGGRFANTGDVTGHVDIVAGGDSQVLLATGGQSLDLIEDSHLAITGTRAQVGFDGASDAAAVLRMNDGATLSFVATRDGLGSLAEFRSGAMGDANLVTSGMRLDGTLDIDLDDWKGSNKAGTTMLIDTDQLIGTFDDVVIKGLGKEQDALIRIDYVRDEVSLVLGDQGKGHGDIRTVTSGDAAFVDHSDDAALAQLWDALQAPSGPMSDNPLL